MGGHRYDRRPSARLLLVLPDGARRLYPVQDGHLQIHEDEVRLLLGELHGLRAVLDHSHPMASLLKDSRSDSLIHEIVLG